MAKYARLPDGSLFPAAEGETYEQTLQAAYAKYPERFGEQPAAQAGPKSGFMPAMRAGWENLKGDVAALAGRSGIMDLAAAEKYRNEREAAAQKVFKPTEEGWSEAPLTKLGELAGGSAPYMAAPVAAGMLAATPFGAGTLAATVAGATGAGLTSAAQFTGSNLSRQIDEGKKLGETDLGAAALASVPQAALDMVSFKMTPGLRNLIFQTTGKRLAEKEVAELAKQGLKATAKDYALSTGKTMTVEGLTEAAQQVFERMQAGLSLTDEKARAEYLENFLGGAVLGGAIAPAGRFMERGRVADEQAAQAELKKNADALAARQQEEQTRVARLQDPAYLDDLLQRSQDAGAKLKALEEAAKGKADPTDPLAVAQKREERKARADYLRSDEYKALQQELQEAGGAVKKRQFEVAAQQEAEAKRQAEEAAAKAEQERVANLSPEQYALEQVQQEGAQWGGAQTGGRKKGALGAVTKQELADIRAQREQEANAPVLAKQKELQDYAAGQFEHPRSLGMTDTSTLVSYLMQDPAKAREIVATQTPMPDLTAKQNRELHAALDGVIRLQDQQRQKADKAETAAEYAQRTADMQGQLPQKETKQDQKTAQTMESWQQSMEDDEKVRQEGEHNLDYIEGILDRNLQGDKRVVEAAPVQVTGDADAKQKQIDDLYAQLEQAKQDGVTAKAARESAAVRAAQTREQEVSKKLNDLLGADAYTGSVVKERFAQQEALDEIQNNAERIRQGQYLGYKFNKKYIDTSGYVADLDAQIQEVERAKETATNKGRLARLNAELTKLKQRRADTASRATEKDQTDLASTTQPLLWKKAEKARDTFVSSVLREAATHRAARGLKGLTHDEAIKAASELHDLLDLRTVRKDGESNAHIRKRLQEIQQGLNNPARERTKIAAEPLNVQYAATEAKKTAEEKGETATTLSGELRRRSEYVQNLIEKALGRDMPDNVRGVLQDAQRALEDGRVTRDLLNAAETQAERVLTGRLKGTKTTYEKDPTKRGRGVAQTDLEEDPRYVDDIRDALAATEATPEEQGELFAPVNNKPSIAQRDKENAQYEADIKEQQALIGRLEDAVLKDKTDSRAAAERIVGIRQDIETLQQKMEANRLEIMRLEQEERDKRAVSEQIERTGTPEQEPQVHETASGFVPDDQEAAFGKKPALSTAVLGYIRATAANFAKSPMVVKAREMAAKLRGTSEEAIANANLYKQIEDVRTKAVKDLREKLDAVNNLFLDNEWVRHAYPQLYANMRAFDKNLGGFYAAEERNKVLSARRLDDLSKSHDALTAKIAKVNADVRATLSKAAENDPRVIAAKKKANTEASVRDAIKEQTAAYHAAMDAAFQSYMERAAAVKEAFYAPAISRLEGEISGLQAQLAEAKGHLESRLMQSDMLLQEAQQKGQTFYALLEQEFNRETADVQKAVQEAQTRLGDLYERSNARVVSEAAAAAAQVDASVQLERKALEKLHKKLNTLLGGETTEASDLPAATEAMLLQVANDSKDAIYKAQNEALQRNGNLKNEAATAAMRREIADLEARAKQITDSKKFKGQGSLDRAKMLDPINSRIRDLQVQIRALTGEKQTVAPYERQARNKSLGLRRDRLQAIIADEKSSTRRVARAQQALDVVQQRIRKLGEVSSPVQRDVSKRAGAKKYVHQTRTPANTQTAATANDVAATLRTNKKLTKKQAAALDRKQQDSLLKIAADRVAELNSKLTAAKEKQEAYSKLHPDIQKQEVKDRLDAEVNGLTRDLAMARANVATLGAATETAAVGQTDTQSGTPEGELDMDKASEIAQEKNRTLLGEEAAAHVRDGNLISALESIGENGSTEFVRQLAKRLIPFVGGTKIGIQRDLKHKGEIVAGLYHGSENRISINPWFMTEEDVLHEVVHAATMQALNNLRNKLTTAQAAAVKQLEGMYNQIKNNPAFKDEYATTDLEEFIAEVYTNPELRDKLDGIGKPTSLLQRMWHALLRMFGMEPSQKAIAAIDAIMSESGRVAAPDRAAQYYHGSPANDITAFRGIVHLTPSKGAAEKFANREVAMTAQTSGANPTVYSVNFDTTNTLDFRKAEHRAKYDAARKAYNRDNLDNQLPALNSEGFIHSGTGVPMFGRVRSILEAMPEFDSVFVEDGSIHGGLTVAARAGAINASGFDRAAKAGRSAFENRTVESRSKARQLWDVKDKAGLAARQAVADMRASLREVLNMGDKFTGVQAQASLLMADSYVGNAQAVAEMGAMHLVKDSKGYVMMKAGNSKSLTDVFKAIGNIPLKNADDRFAKFQGYVTALRGEQVGFDKLDFKDAAQTEKEGRALLADIRANPELHRALQEAHEVYRDLNRGMLEFLKETHALPESVVNDLLADKNYIPFYREHNGTFEMLMPDGHPQSIGDIRSLPYLQALKGGDDKLMAFPEAALRNISVLTNLGVQNMANRHIAYHLSSIGRTATGKVDKPMQVRRRKGAASDSVLRWNEAPDPRTPGDNGERHIVLDTEGTAAEDIPTPLLTQAVAGSYATFPALLEAANYASNLLRAGVTRNPAYVLRQLIKDPMNASLTGNLKSSPLTAVAQAVRNFFSIMRGTSVDEAALRKAGVLHSNVFSGGKGDLNKVAMQIAGDQQGFIKRGIAGLDKLAMSADAATRTQAYKDAIASGASETEAVMAARELANFQRHGAEASVQFLARAIPFFNASIQGLDATLRSAQGKMPANKLYNAKQRFFNRAMGLAGMAVMYSVLMEDDEEWRKMSLRDKISYIHIPRIFGEYEALRLPAPFEMGMLFYSMPMAMMEAMKGEFTSKDWKVVRDVFMAQMPGSGSIMPQLFKGAYDVSRNYDSFTGRPITPKSLEGLDPVQQFTARTTEAAKRMAEGLNAMGVKLSPIQLEFLANSYLGAMPTAVAQMTNDVFAPLDKLNIERPTKRMSEMPIIGGFFQNKRGTEDVEHMYEFASQAKVANDTFSHLKDTDPAAAREYLLEHKPEIAMAKFAGEFTKVMGNFKKMEDLIRNSPRMDSDTKQAKLEQINEQRQKIAENFRAVLKRMPAPAQ